MKKYFKILALLFLFVISQKIVKAQIPYMMSIEFEYSTPSRGYGMALVPNFSIGSKVFWLSAGVHFGVESGDFDEKLYPRISSSRFINEVSGDVIDKYHFSDLESGYQYGAKAFINYLVILSSYRSTSTSKRIVDDYFIISLGARYTIHPMLKADYQVTSHDNSYRYIEYVTLDLESRYSGFAPEIALNYDMFGVFYARQKLRSGDPLHTIGVRINVLGGLF